MRVAALLRVIAVAIAIGGLADPVLTRTVARRPPLTIAAITDGLLPYAATLRDRLDELGPVTVRRYGPPSAAACPSSGTCIIVSDGTLPARLTAGATVIAGVLTGGDPLHQGPGSLMSVEAPAKAHAAAAATLRVTTSEPGPDIEVWDGDVLVGRASGASSRTVDVPWVPVAAGARKLRVKTAQDAIDVGVVVEEQPMEIYLYEPEATWIGTFVRRALADDPRFRLTGRTSIAPSIAIARGNSQRLTSAALSRVPVVIVTALDALTTSEVDLLNRFVTRRGGTLVLLPARAPTGPARQLVGPISAVRLETTAVEVGPLRARELLVFDEGPGVDVLERAGDAPVVIARSVERGRIVVSGALDAWRDRGNTAFNRFWAATIADAANAAGPPLAIGTTPQLATPGEEVAVQVELRSLDDIPSEQVATARVECPAGDQHLRLWPGPRPGVFTGTFRSSEEGECRVGASVGNAAAAVPVRISRDIRRPRPAADALASAVRAYGGHIVRQEADAELLSIVRQVQPAANREPTRPMQSPWWIVPFAVCLGGEWWLRRTAGRR